MQYRSIRTVTLNNACITASISKKNILLPQSIFQHYHPLNHLELDLTANFGAAKVGQRKATRSKIKLRKKKKEEELTTENNKGRFMKNK